MKKELSSYIQNISLIILGVLLIVFPIIYSNLVTDAFILPKQIILAIAVLSVIVLWGVKMIAEEKVSLRKTPFNTSLILFMVVALVSSFLSVNRNESLMNFVPLLFAVILYFIIINSVKDKASLAFILYSLLIGVAVVSLVSILSFFKIYILPSAMSHTQAFTTLGSLLDQAIFILAVIPVSLFFARANILKSGILKDGTFVKEGAQNKIVPAVIFSFITTVLSLGFLITLYELIKVQHPTVLPFETGLQTAFAAISQDTGRMLQSLIFGSGFGTYFYDFAKFKQAAFNLNADLWSLQFTRSSSLILELLATTGVAGLIAFILLIVKAFRELKISLASKSKSSKALALSLGLMLVLVFILPFSYNMIFLFVIALAIFSVERGLHDEDKFFDVELHFVAFKNGIIPFSTSPANEERSYKKVLPYFLFSLFLIFAVISGLFSAKYVIADNLFQQSFVAASQNNGSKLYSLQSSAIQTFPYKDTFYRSFSQTNLVLATTLASQQPKDKQPSKEIQQTIYNLIQNSINSARSAVTISPANTINWQTLSSTYRNLIGFGQNAENFAIVSSQQAVLLDPNNPQEYINLGGIYYQLGQWENAQRQFQIAVNLKPDYANAYYNLGHTLESKNDLQGALTQYQTVKSLVTNDPENFKRISGEIEAIKNKINNLEQAKQQPEKTVKTTEKDKTQEELKLSTPSAKLPEQKPPVKIPAPNTSTSPTPSRSVSPFPTGVPTPAI